MVDSWKNKFNRKYKQKLDQPNSKKDISRLTGVPMSILDQVYYRGIGAFKTNRASVRPTIKSPEAWGMARVYSFVGGGKTQKTADADLWAKFKAKKKK